MESDLASFLGYLFIEMVVLSSLSCDLYVEYT